MAKKTEIGNVKFSYRMGTPASLAFVWRSDTNGVAILRPADLPISGWIHSIHTLPSVGDAPTANYNITLVDDLGFDVLRSAGLLRAAAAEEEAPVEIITDLPAPVVAESLTFKVDSAGSEKRGTAVVYIHVPSPAGIVPVGFRTR